MAACSFSAEAERHSLKSVVKGYFTLNVVAARVVNNDYSANKSSMTTCDCITAL